MAPEARRQAIIEATLPLLLEHGAEVSTREIACAAGVAEGTIFRVFDTKQDLIHAAIHAAMAPEAAIAAIEALPPGQSLTERVTATFEVLRAEIVRTRSVLTHFTRMAGPAHPPVRGPGHLPDRGDGKARLGAAVAHALNPYADQLAVSSDFAARALMALSFAVSFTMPDDPGFHASELAEVVLHGIAKGD